MIEVCRRPVMRRDNDMKEGRKRNHVIAMPSENAGKPLEASEDEESADSASGGEEADGGEGEGGESEVDSQASDPVASEDSEAMPEQNIQDRPTRQTRGQRAVLDGKDRRDDEDFFANAGFRDASSDSDFNDHEDSDDTQATDFSQAQDDASAEEPPREAPVRARKKPMLPPSRPPAPSGSGPAGSSEGTAPARRVRRRIPQLLLRSNRILRKSTMEIRAHRELKAGQAHPRRQSLQAKPEAKPLTQEERLQEAVRTEERNRQQFQQLQSDEDEKRRSSKRARRTKFAGPRLRFVSRLSDSGQDMAKDAIGARPGVESYVELIDCDVSDFLRLPNTQEAKQSLWLDLEEDDRSLQKKVFAHTRFVPSA
eukprot:s3346_g5.t1